MDKVKKIITLSFLSFVLVFGISGCKNNIVANSDNAVREKVSNQEGTNKKEEVKQKKESETKATTTEEVATTSIITSDIDTSDWKTYRNEEYGFEVKYPSGYFVRDDEHKGLAQNILGFIFFKKHNERHSDGSYIRVSIEDKLDGDIDYVKIAKIYDTFNKKRYKIVNVKINNKSYAQIKFPGQIITLIKKNNILYKIYFLPAGEIDPDIYNAFLLSFKTIK